MLAHQLAHLRLMATNPAGLRELLEQLSRRVHVAPHAPWGNGMITDGLRIVHHFTRRASFAGPAEPVDERPAGTVLGSGALSPRGPNRVFCPPPARLTARRRPRSRAPARCESRPSPDSTRQRPKSLRERLPRCAGGPGGGGGAHSKTAYPGWAGGPAFLRF